jgi:hypothetical protein
MTRSTGWRRTSSPIRRGVAPTSIPPSALWQRPQPFRPNRHSIPAAIGLALGSKYRVKTNQEKWVNCALIPAKTFICGFFFCLFYGANLFANVPSTEKGVARQRRPPSTDKQAVQSRKRFFDLQRLTANEALTDG